MTEKKIPRDSSDDYSHDAATARREFARDVTGVNLEHVGHYSGDPHEYAGNIEHFMGVAQVPIGLAGPVLVDGEYAKGEFFVPMATAEGTLVASYNRGMKLLRLAGGVKTTIIDDRMQRAPAFTFESAREARDFGVWLSDHFDEVKAAAETTTKSGKLQDIEQYGASRLLFTRFNYTTGDAAGQNMTGKATATACAWITENYPGTIKRFQLEAQLATDKKASHMNLLNTRGKRVVAEATLPNDLLVEHMHATSRQLFQARLTSTLGGYLSGVVNNGAHAANGIAAVFMATGQDVANVAESHQAAVYAEVTEDESYYFSVTLPSLIVATYGGGTGLPTQRECLELMDCYGAGGVNKFAEIVAATVLCGDLSLGSAVVADEWVLAHDKLGRNRP